MKVHFTHSSDKMFSLKMAESENRFDPLTDKAPCRIYNAPLYDA